jgi:hypothetical protein
MTELILPENFISISPDKIFENKKHSEQAISDGLYTWGYRVVDVSNIMDFINCITCHVWSPIAFKNGHRHHTNFIAAQYGVLDIDEGVSIKQFKKSFIKRGLFFLIAPSANHWKDKIIKGKLSKAQDRFRAILKFDRIITDINEYDYSVEKLFIECKADMGSRGPSRLFFQAPSIDSFNIGGNIKVLTPTEEWLNKRREPNVKAKEIYKATGKMQRNIEGFLKHGQVFGGARHTSILVTACSLIDFEFTRDDAINLINSAPFDRRRLNGKDIDISEITNAVDYALKGKETKQ